VDGARDVSFVVNDQPRVLRKFDLWDFAQEIFASANLRYEKSDYGAYELTVLHFVAKSQVLEFGELDRVEYAVYGHWLFVGGTPEAVERVTNRLDGINIDDPEFWKVPVRD
jgi:hypothetical protein